MTRIVLLAPEPIRPRMAGMGIRALELARALAAAGMEAELLVPNDPAEAREASGNVPVTQARMGALAEASRGADAAVVSGHAANWWFHQAARIPVAADLYDPFPIENLHYAGSLGESVARHDRATLALSLARADFFLCASPEQRLFYAGALYASGRIGAANFPEDPELAELIAVVPFGVPEQEARGDRKAGRAAAGVSEDGPMVLFGGIYDWYDPELLLNAWPHILERHPNARLLFFDSPNPETTPQRLHAAARERARRLDHAGRSIVFSPWFAYGARADLYAATDLIVTLSCAGLETDLSYRTRLLDAAWGGVPSVSVEGGSLADALEREGAALRAPRDAAALAETVAAILADPGRRARLAENARRFASRYLWQTVAAPLAEWCRRAQVDPNRLSFPEEDPFGGWKRLRRRVLGSWALRR